MLRSDSSPFRIEPHLGKVSQDDVKSSGNKHWAVLHQDVAGLNLTDDAGHLFPQSTTFVFKSLTFTGRADSLAGKTTEDHVDASSPGVAVEGADVVPDREGGQASVCLAGEQDASAVGINFNSAGGYMSEEQVCEDPSSCSCEKVHGSEFSSR